MDGRTRRKRSVRRQNGRDGRTPLEFHQEPLFCHVFRVGGIRLIGERELGMSHTLLVMLQKTSGPPPFTSPTPSCRGMAPDCTGNPGNASLASSGTRRPYIITTFCASARKDKAQSPRVPPCLDQSLRSVSFPHSDSFFPSFLIPFFLGTRLPPVQSARRIWASSTVGILQVATAPRPSRCFSLPRSTLLRLFLAGTFCTLHVHFALASFVPPG